MPFESTIFPGERIFDDNSAYLLVTDPVVGGEQMSRGRMPRPASEPGFGVMASLPEIPESEWADRLAEKEKNKSLIAHVLDQAGLSVLNQNGTSYCWINAPTHCVEIMRVMAGLPLVRLSPASVGAPIKGFRNQGGWGTEGLRYIAEHGLVPQSMWPANAIDRKYDTPETKAVRAQYRAIEWEELPDRSFGMLASYCLYGIPVAIGLNWWSHEVTAIDLVALPGGGWGIRINNSWGTSWESNGRGILTRSKATPDDACALRVATPSSVAI